VLTAKKVERVKAPGRYHDGHGLYLQVRNTTNKSWLLRFERDGKERWYGIGPTHTVTLKEARERARAARLLLLDNIDPIDHRRGERAKLAAAKMQAITFREAMRRYHALHEAEWRNRKHAAQFLSSLETYARPILTMTVDQIGTPEVLRCIEPNWMTKWETMNRVRGRIERILDWCKVRNFRSGDNPAAWRGHLKEALPARAKVAKVEHHPAPSYTEVPAIVAALRTREAIAARALEFAILCASRTGEILHAKWSEIDWNAKMWVLSPDRMKSGRQLRVALSQRALDLLRSLPVEDGNDHIFVGASPGTGLSPASLTQMLRRLRCTDASVHGLCRATFKTWATECSAFPNELVELALSHAVGDKTERAYLRGDGLRKRFALAEAWARYISTPRVAATAPTGTVVTLQGHARA
jgi:integrase